MSQDQVQALQNRYRSDAAFRAEMDAAQTPDEVVRIANEHGFALSLADLTPAERELSDEELESQSGGRRTARQDCLPTLHCAETMRSSRSCGG